MLLIKYRIQIWTFLAVWMARLKLFNRLILTLTHSPFIFKRDFCQKFLCRKHWNVIKNLLFESNIEIVNVPIIQQKPNCTVSEIYSCVNSNGLSTLILFWLNRSGNLIGTVLTVMTRRERFIFTIQFRFKYCAVLEI